MINLSSDLLNSVKGILDEVISTPEEKREAEYKLKELDIRELEARSKVQASWLSNNSFFVSGAIPSMLWMLVLVIFFNFILSPLLMGCFKISIPVLDLPDWYSSMCSTIVLGLFAKKAWDSSDLTIGNMTKKPKMSVAPEVSNNTIEEVEDSPKNELLIVEQVNSKKVSTSAKKNKKAAPTTPATEGIVADYSNPDYINARLKELAGE